MKRNLMDFELDAFEKHQNNMEKWGVQEFDILLLATLEELGELSQAYLEYKWENGSKEKIEDELIDLWALMYGFSRSWEHDKL